MARNNNGLPLIPRGVNFDQILEFVIINIVCSTSSALRTFQLTKESNATYMAPTAAQIVPGKSGRTSCLLVGESAAIEVGQICFAIVCVSKGKTTSGQVRRLN